ncbi:hypothetical protein B0H17DRAFT_942939 [Mycena rosella]|uniref:Aminoglycoside phosphotransferase domain-containing protein n=1 Tax=Mycena rosella TaxID=1033263 RepID=A0AAD7D7X3_MYCRO|nr:hypothetical protein B0H17DRAFT_942939 [Mycena rosella]
MNGLPWEDLPLEAKLIGVRDFASIVSQLSQLHFRAIGSIYFKFGDQFKQNPVGFVLGPVSWCKPESAARAAAFHHDRGPWKAVAQWLSASVEDEIQFVEKLPTLALETSTRKNGLERRCRLAQKILPKFRDRIPDLREDPFDQCATGPFVLGHMDLNPWNMIFCPKGPNAGRIVSIIDWEMSLTVPLWSLVCYPLWFDRISSSEARKPAEGQYFKDAYIRQLLQVQQHAKEAIVLRVVQNAQYEARRRFLEIAILPWDAAEVMERWMEQNPRRR